MNTITKKTVVECKSYGRNKFVFKYIFKFQGDTVGECFNKKYCNVGDIVKDPDIIKLNLKLNRQKIYRIRNNQYSTKSNTSASALKRGLGRVIILDIREERKTVCKLIRFLV